jgi:hypothetical protein
VYVAKDHVLSEPDYTCGSRHHRIFALSTSHTYLPVDFYDNIDVRTIQLSIWEFGMLRELQ